MSLFEKLFRKGKKDEEGYVMLHDAAEMLYSDPEIDKNIGQAADWSVSNMMQRKSFEDDPDYGLIPEKPILVHGYFDQRSYMERLQTTDGEEIEFTDKGTVNTDKVGGPVGIYQAKTKSGKSLPDLYISYFCLITSNKAPRGFQLKEI